MKRQVCFAVRLTTAIICALTPVANVFAMDLESFEFNDAAGSALANAINTANPGNAWLEGSGMAPSDIRGGSYNIVKMGNGLVSNYFQVENITSGTRYLVATLSGWDFPGEVAGQPEEFRLAFMNDDDDDFGATITAQMIIRRNAEGGMELVGTALGNGSSNISGAASLATTKVAPITLALELNKTSNSYKVFYKDGANPTQVLGLGSIAPMRDGNSVRMGVLNDFGDFSLDYPNEYFDFLSVDRIAVTDANPFTDLLTLEIDRVSGTTTLRNTSGAQVSGVESYSITSTSGSLNPPGWDPVGTSVITSTNSELAEAFGLPLTLAVNQNNVLSTGPGAWLKSPFEDVQMELNVGGGMTRTVNVQFVGNGGAAWQLGDLNFDNEITVADWELFHPHSETDLSGFSRAAAYQRGDLDGDGMNSISDFIEFKRIYNTTNGIASFDAMIANVPEPSCFLLLAMGAFTATFARHLRRPI